MELHRGWTGKGSCAIYLLLACTAIFLSCILTTLYLSSPGDPLYVGRDYQKVYVSFNESPTATAHLQRKQPQFFKIYPDLIYEENLSITVCLEKKPLHSIINLCFSDTECTNSTNSQCFVYSPCSNAKYFWLKVWQEDNKKETVKLSFAMDKRNESDCPPPESIEVGVAILLFFGIIALLLAVCGAYSMYQERTGHQ